ncbi:MAG: hypothetical protein HYX76_10430 [Acidobacteria bacterium]|nr:hypothetical protein [Acidobacteriota bacterium]
MRALETEIVLGNGGRRTVLLGSYLDASDAEAAEGDANRWIKQLRLTRVDNLSFRDRFTYRGDSLWWSAELFLHKGQRIAALLKTIYALEALIEREQPRTLAAKSPDALVRGLAPQIARRLGVAYAGDEGWPSRARAVDRARTAARAAFYAWTAAIRERRGTRARRRDERAPIATFIHSAFWRADRGDEAYVGPVVRELVGRIGWDAMRLIGLGPRTNYRARGWRERLAEFRAGALETMQVTPIEKYVPAEAVRPSQAVWRERQAMLRALETSCDVRDAAIIRGCDVWPIVQAELAGVCHLQFPWSARAMDEAGAALDALEPHVAVTYAEAGGWGRALALDARRRGIPFVGLQHGFIYRHWLNYLHEPDEMQPSAVNSADRGFPLPDLTLVYDELTARHLIDAGRFPPSALVVTGSPRLDALLAAVRSLTEDDRQQARRGVGADADQPIVLVASKYSQIGGTFGSLVQAAAGMPEVKLVVKAHPAESPEPYRRAAAGAANVVVADGSADLARLLAVARLVVTVNSTVAVDGLTLGIPALVVALPNNLSPFVDAGAMAGAQSQDDVSLKLRALVYDERARDTLTRSGRALLERSSSVSDGGAARRAGDAILGLASRHVASPDVARPVRDSDPVPPRSAHR